MKFTLHPGAKPDFVQIQFEHVPSPLLRSELKAAGFRYNPRSRWWWGLKDRLPKRYDAGAMPDGVTSMVTGRVNGAADLEDVLDNIVEALT